MFSSLWQWFIDNKLSIHFGEDKTKPILFSQARKGGTVKYLGCGLDPKLSGEGMTSKSLKNKKNKLKLLY